MIIRKENRNFGECYFESGTNIILIAESIAEIIVMAGLIYYDTTIKSLLRGKGKITIIEALKYKKN